jgi:hypothetical protein
MRGQWQDTEWHYAQKNAQHCTHQGTKPPPQAFKHCLATMQARDRKQGSRARDNDLAAMYPIFAMENLAVYSSALAVVRAKAHSGTSCPI